MTDSPSGGSQILADRLRTHRIESKRARRKTDFGPSRPTGHGSVDDDIFVAEAHASDLRSSFRGSRRLTADLSSDTKATESADRRRQPGVREMDEKLQKLEKLNFDLKMEVYHRREREEMLKEQLKEMHKQLQVAMKMQEEHATLLRLNKNLTVELDKSNQAVDQAVQMICDLEARTEELEQREQASLCRSQSAYYSDSGYAGSTIPVTAVISPTPPRKRTEQDSDTSPRSYRAIAPPTAKRSMHRNRVPSFMSNTGAENLALREAYGGSTKTLKQAQSFVSMFSQGTDGEGEKLHDLPSPRLSVLSESSFPSIYDSKKTTCFSDAPAPAVEQVHAGPDQWEHSSLQDSIKRVSNWIDQDRTLPKVHQPEFDGVDIQPAIPAQYVNEGEVQLSGDSDAGNSRPSTTSTNFDPTFVGWPDGGSIVTGTPSRFRLERGVTNSTSQDPSQYVSDTEIPAPDTIRPSYIRASTSPTTHPPNAWPLTDDASRQDSFTSAAGSPKPRSRTVAPLPSALPAVKPDPAAKLGTRAALAAKTHRFFRLGGGRDTAASTTMPPPKPDMRRKQPLSKSATAADVSIVSIESSDGGQVPNRTGKTRRRSVDPASLAGPAGAQGRRKSIQPDSLMAEMGMVPDMSRNGAQAAWG
ncbi:hypothetical protein K461DRAFT_116960 [Myriangium duriaei CBS 260.36]|uniref:Centrosomin N-terminal motif 1 domain-containing protein n=1 Tax=Myriangium duriaei CBS 260.36 TaxID=1168546 RepID=A0A9P4J1P0_9PEZI|nr:hypothetical protein K461DRAFT_116960 [Myriangium duriaei CBS 260.36]